MSFVTDKQTLEDLNLLGKYRQSSIFSIFNHVKTVGGEKFLDSMFRNPLKDADHINHRSAIFLYFQNAAHNFPFNYTEFDAVENYLAGASGISKLAVFFHFVKKKILAAVVAHEEYKIMMAGLLQVIVVLNTCKSFLNRFTDIVPANPYYLELNALKEILEDKRLAWLNNEKSAKRFSLRKAIKYDYMLRNELRTEMTKVREIIYQLDVYIAVSKVAETKGFSYAVALPKEDNALTASELRHPGIENGIGNAIDLSQQSNLIFLTGANMAGKSTFMKTLGVNTYLAHMGFPVAAKEMQFSVKDGIYTSINVSDNLNLGYSHFYAEVLRVKAVAEAVSEKKYLLVIFDELFKGTNVKDAYDATLAVTAAFAVYRNCFFVISTHIIEVGQPLQEKCDNIQSLYLPTIMNGAIPSYSYKIQQGVSADRHGMTIIENEKILELLKLEI